ncbi:MAG TPA: sugar phosphate isomerase/epimerase [Urbifossiella sp.]|nr:sugar phosphate isomerase/epimerase [Urbifossiella sp.]
MTRPTRRECLAAVLAAGGVAAAQPAPPRLPLGFSLYGMKAVPLPDALRTCAAVGYDGVELALLPGYTTEPARLTAADRRELRGRLGDSGLSLLGLMENLTEPAADAAHRANLDRLRAAAELGHALSPDRPPPVETVLGGRPADWDAVKDRMAERLRAWAEVGRAARTVVAVKPHVGGALHTPAAAAWLVGQVNSPWLRLAFDHSHYSLRGVAVADAVRTVAPLAAFAHVKDARGSAEKFEFLLPGEHGTNYPELVRLLTAAGYRGPVVVEVSAMLFNRAGYDPTAAARTSYSNLAAAFGRPAKK